MKSLAIKIAALAILGLTLNTHAGFIYNNSTNDLVQRLEADDGLWFGDEVVLAGTDRFMTGFDFQFWATNTTGLTISVELRLQDGPLYNGEFDSPNTLIYAFYNFGVSDTPRSTLNFNIADLDLYDTVADGGTLIAGNILTLAVQFNFNSGGGQAGVDLYGPVDIGGSYPDYWQLVGTEWQLTTNNTFSVVNFGMRIEAVPEPSVFALVLLGGLAGLFGRRILRRRS